MSKALGIVNFSGNHIWVKGMEEYRPIGAFSFLGRYRVIDFPISNMSNSGIDRIQVYIRRKPRSLVEHLGTGRHYNINSKRGISCSPNPKATTTSTTRILLRSQRIWNVSRGHTSLTLLSRRVTWYTLLISALCLRTILNQKQTLRCYITV